MLLPAWRTTSRPLPASFLDFLATLAEYSTCRRSCSVTTEAKDFDFGLAVGSTKTKGEQHTKAHDLTTQVLRMFAVLLKLLCPLEMWRNFEGILLGLSVFYGAENFMYLLTLTNIVNYRHLQANLCTNFCSELLIRNALRVARYLLI